MDLFKKNSNDLVDNEMLNNLIAQVDESQSKLKGNLNDFFGNISERKWCNLMGDWQFYIEPRTKPINFLIIPFKPRSPDNICWYYSRFTTLWRTCASNSETYTFVKNTAYGADTDRVTRILTIFLLIIFALTKNTRRIGIEVPDLYANGHYFCNEQHRIDFIKRLLPDFDGIHLGSWYPWTTVVSLFPEKCMTDEIGSDIKGKLVTSTSYKFIFSLTTTLNYLLLHIDMLFGTPLHWNEGEIKPLVRIYDFSSSGISVERPLVMAHGGEQWTYFTNNTVFKKIFTVTTKLSDDLRENCKTIYGMFIGYDKTDPSRVSLSIRWSYMPIKMTLDEYKKQQGLDEIIPPPVNYLQAIDYFESLPNNEGQHVLKILYEVFKVDKDFKGNLPKQLIGDSDEKYWLTESVHNDLISLALAGLQLFNHIDAFEDHSVEYISNWADHLKLYFKTALNLFFSTFLSFITRGIMRDTQLIKDPEILPLP